MRLLVKFSLIFVLVFGIGLGAAGLLFRRSLQRNARDQVLYNAQLMLETALAARTYTTEQVGPAFSSARAAVATPTAIAATGGAAPGATGDSRVDDVFRELCARHGVAAAPGFRPQQIPAFAATELFNYLRRKYPDYSYKEASSNPTNPRNRAVDWEEDILKEFRTHPDMAVFQGERMTPFGRALFLARPLRADKGCLQCHGKPSDAPSDMLKLYGSANGFGWRDGDVIASRIVSVPVSLPVEMADSSFRRILTSLVAVGLITLVILDLLLYVTVIRPVSAFAARADEISKGRLDVPELPVRGRDEIAVLAGAFNRMHRSLSTAMTMLDKESPS